MATITLAKTIALDTTSADHKTAATIDAMKSLRLPPRWSSSRRLVDFTYEAYGLLHLIRHVLDLRFEMSSHACGTPSRSNLGKSVQVVS